MLFRLAGFPGVLPLCRFVNILRNDHPSGSSPKKLISAGPLTIT